MEIAKEEPLAHVILATYDYSLQNWLRSSEFVSFVLSSHVVAAAQKLSHVGLHVDSFTTEVIGDFPEPEARRFFQGLIRNNRRVEDKEWACIFEVRNKQLSYLSPDVAQLLLEQASSAALQVCGGNAGFLMTTAGLIRRNGSVQEGWSLVLAVHHGQQHVGYADMIPHVCHSSEGGLARTL